MSVDVSEGPCRLQNLNLSQSGLKCHCLKHHLWKEGVFFKSWTTKEEFIIVPTDRDSWEHLDSCDSCFLVLHNDSIHCKKDGLYFIYSQVTFSELTVSPPPRSVILIRNARPGRRLKKLVEGSFSHKQEGSVWVAKIVKLSEGDSFSINITGDFLRQSTFWGAFQLH